MCLRVTVLNNCTSSSQLGQKMNNLRFIFKKNVLFLKFSIYNTGIVDRSSSDGLGILIFQRISHFKL